METARRSRPGTLPLLHMAFTWDAHVGGAWDVPLVQPLTRTTSPHITSAMRARMYRESVSIGTNLQGPGRRRFVSVLDFLYTLLTQEGRNGRRRASHTMAEEDATWRRLIRSPRSSVTIEPSRRCSATVFLPAASTSHRTHSATSPSASLTGHVRPPAHAPGAPCGGELRARLERASDLLDRARRAARSPRRGSGLEHRAHPACSPACLPDGPRTSASSSVRSSTSSRGCIGTR